MLDEVRPDVVSVAAPTEVHATATVDAAEAGAQGIYCEKPMAPSLHDADRMIAACEAMGAALTIAYPRRWNSHWMRIQELVRDGALGRITDLIGFARGPLLGSGTHLLDTLRMVADAPATWLVATLDSEPGPGQDPTGSGLIVFENGVKAFVAASAGKAHLFEVEIAGTEGVLRTFNNGATHLLRRKATPEEWPPLQEVPFPEPELRSGTVLALTELIRRMEGSDEARSDGDSGRATLELALAFHESHRKGNSRVDLPLSNRDASIG